MQTAILLEIRRLPRMLMLCLGLMFMLSSCAADEEMGLCTTLGTCPEDAEGCGSDCGDSAPEPAGSHASHGADHSGDHPGDHSGDVAH